MKIISWNINGLNSAIKNKSIIDLENLKADIYCFQEVKASKNKMPKILDGYFQYHVYAEKNGYSGVSTFSKEEPLAIIEGVDFKEIDKEARVLTFEFKDFFLINVYFPHSSRDLKRIDFKMSFNSIFLNFCKSLEKLKPLVITGDFNVAHKEIDLKNPQSNKKNAGFTNLERLWFTQLLESRFIDTFREFDKSPEQYTWWSYMHNARERNIGWRIDYFIVSSALKNKVSKSTILKDLQGSDHCPIELEID